MQKPSQYAAAILFLLTTATITAVLVDSSTPYVPNISHCHASFSDAGAPLYCCPNPPESTETVIDFDLDGLAADTRPLRIRRPAHVLSQDSDYVAKYERAVELMKALPHDHPHSFRRQANMHCIYCTGAYDQVNSTDGFKIHRSWFFFPWHRAFIYFHEMILGKLIGDDNFALPYWQWDAPEGMTIPDMFVRGVNTSSLDHHNREATHLPPAVVINDYVSVETGLSPDDQIAHNLAFMYTQMVSAASKPELFMGCRFRPGKENNCDGPGTIEDAPHNTLHDWVGNSLNPEGQDMGAFYAAARDPIFYAHHSNIDRMWTVWKKMHGHRLEFDDPVWLDTQFYFHDENLRLVRVKLRDFLNTSRLGYGYEEADTPWMNARPKPTVDPSVARPLLLRKKEQYMRRLQQQQTRSVSAVDFLRLVVGLVPRKQQIVIPPIDFGPEGRLLNCIFTVLVPRTAKSQHRQLSDIVGQELLAPTDNTTVDFAFSSAAAASHYSHEDPEEVLVIYGINAKKDMPVKFEVYVNVVDDAEEAVLAAGPRAREFAGTYVGMRSGIKPYRPPGHSGKGKNTVLKLGISELLRDLLADDDDAIWVTIVPVGGMGEYTTIEGIRIEHMAW